MKREKIAVAFKVSDGSEEEWQLVITSILEQLGYENKETIERINSLRPKEIINATGGVSGEYHTVFSIKN